MRLEFVGQFELFGSTWSLAYAFTLTPIAIGRIDIVESKIFDLEEAVHGDPFDRPFCSEFEVKERVYLQLKSLKHCEWKRSKISGSETFSVVGEKKFRAHEAGTYLIGLQMNYSTSRYQTYIGLWKEDQEELLMRTALHNSAGYMVTMYLQWYISVKKDEDLEFVGDDVTIYPGTKMVIIGLGD